MTTKFSFSELITIGFIFFNVYAIAGSFISVSGVRVYVIQIVIFVIIFILSLNKEILLKSIKVRTNFFVLLGILLIVFFMFSSFYVNIGVNQNFLSIFKLLTYPIIIYLFLFSFPKVLFENDLLFEKFLNTWLIFAVICNILAFIFLNVGVNVNPKFGNVATSIFKHPNTYSFVFTFAIPIVVYKYFTKQISLAYFLIIEIFFMVGLLFTYSRAAYMGVFISILIITYKKSKAVFIACSVILAILSLTFFLNFAFVKTDSSVARAQIMYTAYSMIFENGTTKLLWGYGISESRKVFIDQINLISVREEVDPHNYLLLMGTQFGIMVTLISLILLIYLIAKAFFLKKKTIPYVFWQKVNLSVAIVVSLLFQNMLEDIIIYPEYYVMPLFLIFLGYLYYSVYWTELKQI